MTPEFGAASQLEKIDMLDFADAVAINKFERRGAEDALRDVRRQIQRNRETFGGDLEDLPVFGTIAARFNDDGVTALYQHLRQELIASTGSPRRRRAPPVATRVPTGVATIVPPARVGYLAEVAETVRGYHDRTAAQVEVARRHQALRTTSDLLADGGRPHRRRRGPAGRGRGPLDPACHALLDGWPATVEAYSGDEHVTRCGTARSAPPSRAPRCPAPTCPRSPCRRYGDDGDLLRWLREENLPGRFPFTGGVFAFKREGEDPTRMFAGEGDAFRTNRRFHLLAEGQPATRLSTAFDSVTLYGFDPDERPDIYGKVGNSGVSIATLDDMRGPLRRVRPVRPGHLGVDDDQRPGPRHPGHVLQHGDRPAPRRLRGRPRPPAHRRGGGRHRRLGAAPTCGARCRPTSSRRTRARTPASSPPSSPCG